MPFADYDFFAPFMRVAIVTPEGRVYPLIPSEKPTEAAMSKLSGYDNSESFPYLTSLTVELQLAYLAKVTAVLSPPFTEAIRFLDSPLIEYGRNELEVQFGYITGKGKNVLSDKFRVLTHQPDVSLGADTTITLVGQGVGSSFSAVAMGSKKSFNNKSAKEIIEDVLVGPDSKNPRQIQVDFDPMMDSPKADDFFFKKYESRVQGHVSDWFFVWSLVREHDGWMFQRGDKLVIAPKSTQMGAPPRFALEMYRVGVNGGHLGPRGLNSDGVPVYPMTSVSSPSKAQYISGMRGLVLTGIDDKSRNLVTEIVNDETLKTQRIGAGGGVEPVASKNAPGADNKTGSGYDHLPGNPTETSRKQAEAEFGSIATNMGIRLEVETIGIPDILPADNVQVTGLGLRYDGNYSVFALAHTFSTSGFSTKLELRSNTDKVLHASMEVFGNLNSKDPQGSNANTASPKKE